MIGIYSNGRVIYLRNHNLSQKFHVTAEKFNCVKTMIQEAAPLQSILDYLNKPFH